MQHAHWHEITKTKIVNWFNELKIYVSHLKYSKIFFYKVNFLILKNNDKLFSIASLTFTWQLQQKYHVFVTSKRDIFGTIWCKTVILLQHLVRDNKKYYILTTKQNNYMIFKHLANHINNLIKTKLEIVVKKTVSTYHNLRWPLIGKINLYLRCTPSSLDSILKHYWWEAK